MLFKIEFSFGQLWTISVSSSKDGIIWFGLTIVLYKGKSWSWENIVSKASIIYNDGIYHMWYIVNRICNEKDKYYFKNIETPILIPEY